MPPKSGPTAKTTVATAPPSSRRSAVAPRAALRGKNQQRITKADAASILGVSGSMVRVLVKQGELAGELVDGVRYFVRDEVIALAAKRAANPPKNRLRGAAGASSSSTSAGELAANAFELLARGVSPVDLVMQMKATPEWVENIVEKFNALRLLEVARNTGSGAKCATCQENVARFCAGCANTVRKAAPPAPAAPSSAAASSA